MSDYPTTRPYRVRQAARRGSYDRETVHAILDAGYVAHIAFVTPSGPVALPMFYVRDGESVLFHGSRQARFLKELSQGADMCFTVTHLDGLVLARSAFHHSMNYRSVMAHGQPESVSGEAKDRAMALFTARLRADRASGERPANAKELRATEVLRLPLVQVAAKVRTGGPIDDQEDMALPVWAGVVPMSVAFGEAVKDVPAPTES